METVPAEFGNTQKQPSVTIKAIALVIPKRLFQPPLFILDACRAISWRPGVDSQQLPL